MTVFQVVDDVEANPAAGDYQFLVICDEKSIAYVYEASPNEWTVKHVPSGALLGRRFSTSGDAIGFAIGAYFNIELKGTQDRRMSEALANAVARRG